MSGFAPPVPVPSNVLPSPEKTGAAIGTDMQMYALPDHQHPRLTSATQVTLDANGLATVVFTRSFPAEPAVDLTPIAPGGTQPVTLQVDSFVMTGANYTGCIIKGFRGQATTLAAVTVVGISVAVGAQTVTPFSAPAASGVRVSVIALMNSNP